MFGNVHNVDGVVRERAGVEDVEHLVIEHAVRTQRLGEGDIGGAGGGGDDSARAERLG